MENSEISIVEALNHIQSWLNAGEVDKVVQGAQEVLELEPGNQRALSLLKQAEEKRFPRAEHAEAKPERNYKEDPAPPYDPLAGLQAPEADDHHERRKLFLAMLVPAIIVVLVGGGAIWWLANREREETIVNSVTSNLPEDRDYLDENEERLDSMIAISKTLEDYKVRSGAYPSVSRLESALAEGGFEEIPSDPRQGEIDKAGKVFGYIYAVYEGIGGENSVYVLSAIFEDGKGFGYAWTKGAPVKNYPDYREFEEANITFIGGDENDIEEPTEPLESPDGPKVNPENQK